MIDEIELDSFVTCPHCGMTLLCDDECECDPSIIERLKAENERLRAALTEAQSLLEAMSRMDIFAGRNVWSVGIGAVLELAAEALEADAELDGEAG